MQWDSRAINMPNQDCEPQQKTHLSNLFCSDSASHLEKTTVFNCLLLLLLLLLFGVVSSEELSFITTVNKSWVANGEK